MSINRIIQKWQEKKGCKSLSLSLSWVVTGLALKAYISFGNHERERLWRLSWVMKWSKLLLLCCYPFYLLEVLRVRVVWLNQRLSIVENWCDHHSQAKHIRHYRAHRCSLHFGSWEIKALRLLMILIPNSLEFCGYTHADIKPHYTSRSLHIMYTQ